MLIAAWIVGSIVFYRAFARRAAWFTAGTQKKLDGFDICFGIVVGAILSVTWPVAVPIYTFFKVVGRIVSDNFNSIQGFLSKPLTFEQKRELKSQKREEAIIAHRKHINNRERELDIPMTKWGD